MTKITNPSDPRLLNADNYAAVALSPAHFRGLVEVSSSHGAAIIDTTTRRLAGESANAASLDMETIRAEIAAMLATGSGERFSAGARDLVALRFVVDDASCTILYVEDYDRPYPCIVDGHIVDRSSAIAAWLGDADKSDHPSLYLD